MLTAYLPNFNPPFSTNGHHRPVLCGFARKLKRAGTRVHPTMFGLRRPSSTTPSVLSRDRHFDACPDLRNWSGNLCPAGKSAFALTRRGDRLQVRRQGPCGFLADFFNSRMIPSSLPVLLRFCDAQCCVFFHPFHRPGRVASDLARSPPFP